MKNIAALIIVAGITVGCHSAPKKMGIAIPPTPPTRNPLTTILPPTPFRLESKTRGFGDGAPENPGNGWVGDPVDYTNITNPRFFTNEFGILFVVSALQRSNNVLTVYVANNEYPEFIAAEFSCWNTNQSWYVAMEYEEDITWNFCWGVNTPCSAAALERVIRQVQALAESPSKLDLVGVRKSPKVYTGITPEEILVRQRQAHQKK